MNRKERLEISQQEYQEYLNKTQSAINAGENPERINSFETYLKNAIEIEKTKDEGYPQL